ncbi:MAG: hypothetical protein E6J74_21340 [Deltaproteobacteria bacterium]|nr:MAG: hypothetical protein E6J74_21340 [Deltaproteobacteria bacterium]
MAYMNRGKEEVSEYAKLSEDLGFAAVVITMDTVKPVKIGDEVRLSTKDGKPRRGHKSTTKDIEWMKQQVSLPVVVKGIMGADAARAAVNAGADALVVSNHGGRILDFNRAALEALPEVVDAAGGKVPVLLDSGIRNGGDIIKALALGANGVARIFAILAEEMQRVMVMTGAARARDITNAILFRDDWGGARAL